MRNLAARASFVFLVASFAAACGLENSLVGGRCRDGMVFEGSTCVDAPSSADMPHDDGGTSPEASDGADAAEDRAPDAHLPFILHDSGPLDTPIWEASNPSDDASAPDGPIDASAPIDAAPPADAGLFDAGPPADAGPVDAGTSVDAGSDVDAGPVDAGPVCNLPLVLCHGACIPVDDDGANCGACGRSCPSNICVSSVCQGATPGDVVLIGHDFTNATSGSAQAKVLVNALTIPTTDPIRVLSYEDGAPDSAVLQTKALATAGISARTVQFTRASSPAALASVSLFQDYDVVLLHDAAGLDPVSTGASWAASLGGFTAQGGVVVALDRGSSPMPELLTSSGLMTVGSHTLLPVGAHLVVAAAADVVGTQVLSPYAAFDAAVSFQSAAPMSQDLAWVIRQQMPGNTLGDPIVIHRVVR